MKAPLQGALDHRGWHEGDRADLVVADLELAGALVGPASQDRGVAALEQVDQIVGVLRHHGSADRIDGEAVGAEDVVALFASLRGRRPGLDDLPGVLDAEHGPFDVVREVRLVERQLAAVGRRREQVGRDLAFGDETAEASGGRFEPSRTHLVPKAREAVRTREAPADQVVLELGDAEGAGCVPSTPTKGQVVDDDAGWGGDAQAVAPGQVGLVVGGADDDGRPGQGQVGAAEVGSDGDDLAVGPVERGGAVDDQRARWEPADDLPDVKGDELLVVGGEVAAPDASCDPADAAVLDGAAAGSARSRRRRSRRCEGLTATGCGGGPWRCRETGNFPRSPRESTGNVLERCREPRFVP